MMDPLTIWAFVFLVGSLALVAYVVCREVHR